MAASTPWRSRSARSSRPNRSPDSRPRKAAGWPSRATARATLNGPPPSRGSTWPAGSTIRSIRASPATVIIGSPTAVLRRTVERGRAGHDRHCLLHRMALRGDDARAATEALDVDAVRHIEDLRHVVADQDDGQASAAEALDQGKHLAGLADAERGGWLVEDDHLRAEGGRACHRDRLALPAGQGFHLLGDVLDRADAQVMELLLGRCPHAPGVELAEDRPERALVPYLPAEVEVARDIQG